MNPVEYNQPARGFAIGQPAPQPVQAPQLFVVVQAPVVAVAPRQLVAQQLPVRRRYPVPQPVIIQQPRPALYNVRQIPGHDRGRI